jgi:hypothetical protein
MPALGAWATASAAAPSSASRARAARREDETMTAWELALGALLLLKPIAAAIVLGRKRR